MEGLILFMDDDPLRAVKLHGWQTEEERSATVWTKNVTETINVLKEQDEHIRECHLDHDLEGEVYVDTRRNDCGMEIVRWFENITPEKRMKFFKCVFTVHTHNMKAGLEMRRRMIAIGLRVKYIPFGEEDEIRG